MPSTEAHAHPVLDDAADQPLLLVPAMAGTPHSPNGRQDRSGRDRMRALRGAVHPRGNKRNSAAGLPARADGPGNARRVCCGGWLCVCVRARVSLCVCVRARTCAAVVAAALVMVCACV